MQLSLPDTIAAMAQTGDDWAINELVRMHSRMIGQHAGNAAAGAFSMTRDDLQQEAVVAMLEFLKSWSPEGGASFFSYCYGWIPHRLRRVKDASDYIVSIPAWKGAKDRREGNQGIPWSTSLYAPSIDGEDDQMLDEVEATAPQHDPVQADLERHMMRLIDNLPERERDIVRATHFDDIRQDELATKYGVTRQAISSHYKQVIAKLKRQMARVQ